MKIRVPFFLLLAFLCTGCITGPATESVQTATLPAPDPAQAKLAEAASSISRSLSNLAEIEQATTPPPPSYAPPNPATYGMANLVSIDWAGPVQPLVSQIAKATGYQVRVLGNPPPVPIMVFVSVKDMQIGNVLRDVGFQTHQKASIVVFPNSRVIELRYFKD
jgi:defect-in-organelle-trafficking protein DotD